MNWIPPRLAQRTDRPAVLVIDDDVGTCETFDWALRPAGFTVGTARSGAEGLAIARSRRFDFILIDLRLPDMLGIDVARALAVETPAAPFALVSAFLTTKATVDAMKLGAIEVLEKPVGVDDLLAVVRGAIGDPTARPATGDTGNAEPRLHWGAVVVEPPALTPPRSAAERWARHVLKACESGEDLRILADWARFAGVSYSTLCESCRLVGIRPHDARDFARVLRAVLKSAGDRCQLEILLDVRDRRTLINLLERAGLESGLPIGSTSVEQFLRVQRLVASDNEGLKVLRQLLVPRAA